MCLINRKQEMTMGNSWREILLRACWKSVLCVREGREKRKEDVGYRSGRNEERRGGGVEGKRSGGRGGGEEGEKEIRGGREEEKLHVAREGRKRREVGTASTSPSLMKNSMGCRVRLSSTCWWCWGGMICSISLTSL